MLQLRHVLARVRRERYLRYSQREWAATLVTLICMAIGNRDQYRPTYTQMMELLDYLRELDLPASRESKQPKSEYEALVDFWVSVFGNPDEMERQQLERDATAGIGESDSARLARTTEEFVQGHFLRGG